MCGACDGFETLTWTPQGCRLEWLILNPTCPAFISINKHGSKVSCVVLFERFNWRKFGRGSRPRWHFSKSLRLLWNPSGVRHDIRAAWHEFELLRFRWEELQAAWLAGDRVQWIGRTQRHILLPWSKFWLSWQIELSCYHPTVTRPHFPACTHSSQVYISPSQSSVYRILWLWHELSPRSEPLWSLFMSAGYSMSVCTELPQITWFF